MSDYDFNDDDTNILDELEEMNKKKKVSMNAVLNKKKISKFEMDDFFMGG
ncbi:hypothetical protein GOV05_01095 [Candidatus Woesearchaeota archaeon]|nr:hypothetical protein [Candidatus Woesearchaeota archaeon]